ncbi:glycosyltransferase [Neorhizobium sp. NCHU2750]|uniref:glycosyltransferase n=1 Tax=Neorhizobium sp. NCHU2750 TaxID=1825976 RepID=UPI000E7697BA|nr:glycosyltransferase [Neorhizobium sp. NCHU2750]
MTVSIIIKTLNDEKRIGRAIECALAALPEGQGEVIVTDLGSRDETIRIASSYPVRVVQIARPARFRSGAGSQLGYQYARHEFVCVIEGDMDLDPDFLVEGIAFLERHRHTGGVTGRIETATTSGAGFTPDTRIGSVERLAGGGLYRRRAIDAIDYMADRNLHGYEELNLGIRLRSSGWKLHRLDRRFARHQGEGARSRDLLLEQMRTKEPFGMGELLRAASGKPYFTRLLRDLPELKMLALAWAFILISAALIAFLPSLAFSSAVVAAGLALIAVASIHHAGGVKTGIYAMLIRFLQAVALPVGYLTPRRNPRSWIESRIVGEPDAEVSRDADEKMQAYRPEIVKSAR